MYIINYLNCTWRHVGRDSYTYNAEHYVFPAYKYIYNNMYFICVKIEPIKLHVLLYYRVEFILY